jgi:mono/diheme cytochrome c family protein
MRMLPATIVSLLLSAACSGAPESVAAAVITGGDARRGAALIRDRECGTCHRIPGIRGATGRAAPSLAWMARRTYIAGRVPNEPEAMVRWVRAPESIDDATAMPNLGLTDEQARDVAAYLFTLR